MTRIYSFKKMLEMSRVDVKAILMANIPGAVDVHKSIETDDRNGTDWWVERKDTNDLSIDCKIRKEDWAAKGPNTDDLALETWSVVEQEIPGWTRRTDKQTDSVLFFWLNTQRWCLMPFPMLVTVFSKRWMEWKDKHKTARQITPTSNGRYHSECVFVPRQEVWAEILMQFGGDPFTQTFPANICAHAEKNS